jgi:hypothetical protein
LKLPFRQMQAVGASICLHDKLNVVRWKKLYEMRGHCLSRTQRLGITLNLSY